MNTWKDKIQEGYLYLLKTNPFSSIAGHEEAIGFGNFLSKKGLPDDFIQNQIGISEDDNLYTDTQFTPISQIQWKETG